MRLQHSLSPPPPGRGRIKRKREDADAGSEAGTAGPDSGDAQPAERRPSTPDSDPSDGELPPSFARLYHPTSGLIAGRSPALAKYVVAKAKAAWIRVEHEQLIEELRVVRALERDWVTAKNTALDELMLKKFGPAWCVVPVASGRIRADRHAGTTRQCICSGFMLRVCCRCR
jgi:hypothetical protein